MSKKPIVKSCITCGEDGHTYVECPKVPFGFLMADAFGVPSLHNDEECRANLQQLYDEEQGIGRIMPSEEDRPDKHGPRCEESRIYKGCKTCWQEFLEWEKAEIAKNQAEGA